MDNPDWNVGVIDCQICWHDPLLRGLDTVTILCQDKVHEFICYLSVMLLPFIYGGFHIYIIYKQIEPSQMEICVYLASKPCGTILSNGMSRFFVKDIKFNSKYPLFVCHGSAYPTSFHAWQQKTFTSNRTISTCLEISLRWFIPGYEGKTVFWAF